MMKWLDFFFKDIQGVATSDQPPATWTLPASARRWISILTCHMSCKNWGKLQDGKGGKLFNQVLNPLHGGDVYKSCLFLKSFCYSKQTQAKLSNFCLKLRASPQHLSDHFGGGYQDHSIRWPLSPLLPWQNLLAPVRLLMAGACRSMGKGSRVRFENCQPKEYFFWGEGRQTQRIITVACGCVGWSPPSLQAIESLDPIKVWTLQGSGSNQKWHSISQSLATAMLRNHHNIPIGPQ